MIRFLVLILSVVTLGGCAAGGGGLAREQDEKGLPGPGSPTAAWIAGPKDAWPARDHHFRPGQKVEKQVVLVNTTGNVQAFRIAWTVEVGGRQVAQGSTSGEVQVNENVLLPLEFLVPQVRTRTDGLVALKATIGWTEHRDRFPFRVYPLAADPPADRPAVLIFDPAGRTRKMLEDLGWQTSEWDGRAAPGKVLVIGRWALGTDGKLPGSVRDFVSGGGRAILMDQGPEWFGRAMGWRTLDWRQPARAARPVSTQRSHPIVVGLDEEDLRDWSDSWSIFEGPPLDYGLRWKSDPPYGPRRENVRGVISYSAIEKPHVGGWSPIMETLRDGAFSPLMELRYGDGLMVVCTLDVEGRTEADPAAELVVRRLLTYAGSAKVAPPRPKVFHCGGDRMDWLAEMMGLDSELPARGRPEAIRTLYVLCPEGAPDPNSFIEAKLEEGAVLLMVGFGGKDMPFGFRTEERKDSVLGSAALPDWPECRGLSRGDLRLGAPVSAHVLVEAPPGGEIAADGLLGRARLGKATVIFLQVSPDMLDVGKEPDLRPSAGRLTRALCRIIANLGGHFAADDRSFQWDKTEFDPIGLAGAWQYKIAHRQAEPGGRVPALQDFERKLPSADLDASDWGRIDLPGRFGEGMRKSGGVVWVRREIALPASWEGMDLRLRLGSIAGGDVAYFNGKRIGETDDFPGARPPVRVYPVLGKLVKAGRNVVAIRVFSGSSLGGMLGRPEDLSLEIPGHPAATGFYVSAWP